MGLDVYAYKNAELVDAESLSEDDKEELHHVFDNGFTDHLCALVDGEYYKAEETDAHYRRSYGSYSAFREVLAKLAGYKPLIIKKPSYSDDDYLDKSYFYNHPRVAQVNTLKQGPFFELIYFSDCEGYIGTEYCKKLAQDFAEFAGKADELEDHDRTSYFQLKQVFEAASENGFAKFC